jgi:hypothetical protein
LNGCGDIGLSEFAGIEGNAGSATLGDLAGRLAT